MLRRLGHLKDDFDEGIKRRQVQLVEVCADVEVKFVGGDNERAFPEQSLAAAIAIRMRRADLMPLAALGVVVEFIKADGNIRGWSALPLQHK